MLNKFKTLSMTMLVLAFTTSTVAVEIPASIRKSDCLACHAPDKKMVGPSFLDIAKKYRGQSVSSTLVQRVKNGSKGVWGDVPATPHKYTSNEDIRDGVNWILKLKEADLVEAPAGGVAMSPAKMAKKILAGSDCMGCHAQSQVLIGPSYDMINKKYDIDKLDYLVKKIKDGGSGAWKAEGISAAMTPHANMKDKDLQLVVKWILGETGEAKAAPEKVSEKPTPAKEAAKAPAKSGGARKVDAAKANKLMNGSDCLACHQPKMKVVGPSWVDIAKKYKGDPKAPAALVKKIKEGGSGAWGAMPMTAHESMPNADIEIMVDYILTVK